MTPGRRRLPGTPAPIHTWTTPDGLRIAGDAWGDLGAPLVLLLHGGGQTRHAWRNTGRLLAEAGYRGVAYDARGHGDSDWSPQADYGVDAMVRDLVSVLAAQKSARPILIGASMGGGTSLIAIGEGLVEAGALILVDSVPLVEAEGVARIHAFMDQKEQGFASLEEVAEAIAAYQPQRARPRKLDGLAKNVRLGDDGRYYWHWDPNIRTNRSEMQSDRRARRSASARKLTLPTLLVRGGSSDVVSEEGVRDFLALCPHAKFVDVAGAGHMVAGDRNDAFGRVAAEFLRSGPFA